MKTRLALLFVLLGTFLSACSTVEGVGHDISDTAGWVRKHM